MSQHKVPRSYWLGGKRKAEQDRFFQEALDPSRWQPGDAENWHACWYTGMPAASQFRKAGPGRKINHIPGNNTLTVKSRLHDTLATLRDRLCEQYGPGHETVSRLGFLPKVYSMPHDYHALQQAALTEPAKRWILKPKNAARGKGIRLVRDVADVPLEANWMVQEYLERVHTMRRHKYVLRLYVLIASIEPLRVYLYEQGFAKLASAPYDLDDIDNLYSHLTNPDINALNAEADIPVEFVDFKRYRRWLRDEGHDDERLFERIADMVTLTALAAVEPMRKAIAATGADPRGCYELLGLDCLIDDALNPWLLECNLSPSMGICAAPESGGRIEEQVKRRLVADMVFLVGLDASEPIPPTNDPAERIRIEASRENARTGGFQRLYPTAGVERYLPFFSLPRLADAVLADAVSGAPVKRPQLQRRHATEVITGDRLALYDEQTGRLSQLNETASLIWLMAMEGADPDSIAEQLAAAVKHGDSPDIWSIRKDVWDCLADWAHMGLLSQKADTGHVDNPSVRARASGPAHTLDTTPYRVTLRCVAQRVEFHTDSQPVAARMEALLSPLKTESGTSAACRLEVVRDTPGYTLILDGEVIASRITLASVGPALFAHLARRAPGKDEMVMDAGLLRGQHDDAGSVIFAGTRHGLGDTLALQFAQRHGLDFSRGLLFDTLAFDRGRAMGLPGQSGGRLVPASRACLSAPHWVEAVVIPCVQGPPRESGIQSLSAGEALRGLLPACFLAGGAPIDARTLAALVDWLSGRELYSVDVSDFEAAIEALTLHLNGARSRFALTSAT